MFRLVSALLLAVAVIVPAECKDHGRGRGHHEEEEHFAREFGPGDRSVIAGYYRSGPHGLPPGLAKRHGGLPPGLEKQLRRNGTLPPGLARRMEPLPVEVERRLPPCPPDTRRGVIGGVAVMYNFRTGLVLDAFAVFGR